MIGKTEAFILLISFLHLICSFPSALGENFKCKNRHGKFPKPGSFCRSYYLCANWRPKEKTCPEDQHFFPAKGYCVWPEEYPCLEKPQSKECPLPDGKFLKPGTGCKNYYDCCKGRPTEEKCPTGTLFDHVRGKCDWPKYVTCPEDVSTTKSTSHSTSTLSIISTISPKTVTDSDEDIISSTTSNEYTKSTEGEVVISSTQPPLTVESSSTIVSSTVAPDDISTIFEISSASFTGEHVTKTATYPEVVTEETHTEIITKETHPEVVTDETHTRVTYTIEDKDGYSTIVTSGFTDSVTSHILCPKPDGYFPHPNDKHKFIACVAGELIVMNCPENFVYDHKRRSCEYNI